MPVAAFGWSAGDIAKAISILNTIYIALKETGGAVSQYQALKASIQGYILILEYLQTLQLESIDQSIVKAVNALGATALKHILNFEKEICKYDSALGHHPTNMKFSARIRKAQYALGVPKRVTKLQQDLEMHLGQIHVILGDRRARKLVRCDIKVDRGCRKQTGLVMAQMKATQNFQDAIRNDIRIQTQELAQQKLALSKLVTDVAKLTQVASSYVPLGALAPHAIDVAPVDAQQILDSQSAALVFRKKRPPVPHIDQCTAIVRRRRPQTDNSSEQPTRAARPEALPKLELLEHLKETSHQLLAL
ncbi:hypothetical protein N0V90_001940 [Kalmusia sp. IMI 367209]|nr:hypothetical protein N0V90_001940 [Kalmusia sp. IMI 367209]